MSAYVTKGTVLDGLVSRRGIMTGVSLLYLAPSVAVLPDRVRFTGFPSVDGPGARKAIGSCHSSFPRRFDVPYRIRGT